MTIPQRPVNEADLHGFADGQITPEREAAVARFLTKSPADKGRVEAWRRQNDVLRAAFGRVAHEPIPLSLSLTQTLRDSRLDAPMRAFAAVGPGSLDLAPLKPLPAEGRGGAAAAFAFVLGVVIALSGVGAINALQMSRTTSPPRDALQELASRALDAHRAFTGDAPALPPPLAAAAADATAGLAGAGLTLVSTRPTPARGAAGRVLMFENARKEPYALLVAPAPGSDGPLAREDFPRLSSVAWVRSGVGFALVARTERDTLLELMRATGQAPVR